MNEKLTPQEVQLIKKALARASQQGWGVAIGTRCGLGLFVATIWLVIKGGPNPGAHLRLLAVYFPGYQISVLGSFIGFVYAFVGGYAVGRTIAAVYNRLLP
jgi:hypothetical protein